MSSSGADTGGTGGRPHLIDSSIWIPVLRPGKLGQTLAPRLRSGSIDSRVRAANFL